MHKVSCSLVMLDCLKCFIIFCIFSSRVCCKIDSVKPAEIKIIDFGSACMEDRTVYSYIQVTIFQCRTVKFLIMIKCISFNFFFHLQSRYYRSPEVLLGYQYPKHIRSNIYLYFPVLCFVHQFPSSI